jgi:ATP-dependent Clp protease ATP-binding subunit ClpC
MFERYDEHARRVIFFARYDASQSGSQVINSRHLLLGIMRESKGLFSPPLTEDGLRNLDGECRRGIAISNNAISNKKMGISVDLPLSVECKHALAEGAAQAETMRSRMIRPLHLALGLISASQDVKELLKAQGITAESLAENPDAGVETPSYSRSPSALLEFVCQGERVASSAVNLVNPLPRTGDEVYLTRDKQAETYKVLRVQHHFEGPPKPRTLAHCWLVKVVVEVDVIGVPPEMTGDT